MTDPNPLVAGKVWMLEAAGIRTESGLLETEARELNRGFLSRIERGRPFVRIKCAASLDGKTASPTDAATGLPAKPQGRTCKPYARKLRRSTGIGTVLADNPRLNVRAFPTLRQPARIVLDSKLQTPLDSHMVSDDLSPTVIVTAVDDEERLKPYRAFNPYPAS